MCRIGDQEQEDALNKLRSVLSTALEAVGPLPVDPLLTELADDPVVAEFHPDAFFTAETGCICLVYTLCYPLNAPCYACACGRMCINPNVFREYSKSRRLVLREHSLLYEIEKGAGSHPMGACCCANEPVVADSVRIVLLLTDDFSLEPFNQVDCSTVALKIKGKPVAYVTLSTVIPDPNGAAIHPFLEKLKAQKQAQTFLPAPKISEKSKQLHELVLTQHQFTTTVPVNSNLTGADLARQMTEFYSHLIETSKKIENGGAPVPGGDMQRDIAVAAQDVPMAAEVPTQTSPLLKMTVEEVCSALKSMELGKYVDAFEKSAVNGAMLSIMDEGTLTELGVASNLDRKRILAWIIQIKGYTHDWRHTRSSSH